MPTLEDFQKFVDKMEVSEEEKAELMKAFTGNKDKVFAGDMNTAAEAARQAMKRTMFQAGGFSGPNYLYFFITVAILAALLGKCTGGGSLIWGKEIRTTNRVCAHEEEDDEEVKFNAK